MPPKRFRNVALLVFFGSTAALSYWYFGAYRAQEVRLPAPGGRVDLSPLGDDWVTLCVIGAYETNGSARALTGLDIDIENRSRSVTYETMTLLVTLHDQGRHRLFDVPRHPSDFVKLSSTCWPHGTEFVIETGPWHYVSVPGDG